MKILSTKYRHFCVSTIGLDGFLLLSLTQRSFKYMSSTTRIALRAVFFMIWWCSIFISIVQLFTAHAGMYIYMNGPLFLLAYYWLNIQVKRMTLMNIYPGIWYIYISHFVTINKNSVQFRADSRLAPSQWETITTARPRALIQVCSTPICMV